MKVLIYILFFLPLVLSGQNLYTNAPEKVFPVLEEFIAENYQRGKPTFDRINRIDSIIIKNLPMIIEGYSEQKVYGYRHVQGGKMWIEIDSSLLDEPLKFEHTLHHELGHVFKQDHLDHKTHPKEIMSDQKYPYYLKPEDFQTAKINFFNSL